MDDEDVLLLIAAAIAGVLGAWWFARRPAAGADASVLTSLQPGDIYTPPPDPDPTPRPQTGLPPPGTVPWSGPVPADLTQFAKDVLHGPFPMHSTVQRGDVVAQVAWHNWSMRSGTYETLPDGIRGVTLFRVA